jgi:hypothetical protein
MARMTIAWLAAALALSACTTGGHARGSAESASVRQPPAAPRGAWRGTVWETPAAFTQGVGAVALEFHEDGTWTGEFGHGPGARRAAGTFVRRGRSVVLDGEVAGSRKEAPARVHLALQERNGVLGGVAEALFSERPGTAMIELHPVPAPGAAAPPGGERGEEGNR